MLYSADIYYPKSKATIMVAISYVLYNEMKTIVIIKSN